MQTTSLIMVAVVGIAILALCDAQQGRCAAMLVNTTCVTSNYRYTEAQFPNGNYDTNIAAAVRSAGPFYDLMNEYMPCASKDRLRQFICIQFFPPCMRSNEPALDPIRICEPFCEELKTSCEANLIALGPNTGPQRLSWPDCATPLASQTTCYRYIQDSGFGSSSSDSDSSSINSMSNSMSDSRSGFYAHNAITAMNLTMESGTDAAAAVDGTNTAVEATDVAMDIQYFKNPKMQVLGEDSCEGGECKTTTTTTTTTTTRPTPARESNDLKMKDDSCDSDDHCITTKPPTTTTTTQAPAAAANDDNDVTEAVTEM